jgi:hypothetical protein
MNHPEELLAEYVDGSLGDAARASVEAHLEACPRCRGEVGLAGTARAAIRRLPQVEAPEGVASKALNEAAGSRAEEPPRYARLLPIAAAAVLVGLLAIALPRLGSDQLATPAAGEAGVTEAADGAAPRAAPVVGTTDQLAKLARGRVRVEKQAVDYDDDGLRALVDGAAARWSGVAFPSATALGFAVAAPSALDATNAGIAARCVFEDVPEKKPAILVQLIDATYQDEPAYLAVVLEGSEAGSPADVAVVWIVRKDDCSVTRLVEHKL